MKTCKMPRQQQQLFIKGRIQLTRVNTNDNFFSSKVLLVAKCSLHCAGGVNVDISCFVLAEPAWL